MGDYRTYLFAYDEHRHVRAHIEARKPYDKQERAYEKEHELIGFHAENYGEN